MPGTGREIFKQQHYNVLAKRIREVRATLATDPQLADGMWAATTMLVDDLAEWFSEDNPRFKRELWMEATDSE